MSLISILRVFLLVVFFLSSFVSVSQERKKRNIFPIWTYHRKNTNIHGLSLGAFTVFDEPRKVKTNGIKLELIGVGLLLPMIPQSPIVTTDSNYINWMRSEASERINGINLSVSGSVCECKTNGIVIGGYAQIHREINGLSASLVMNLIQKQSGLQLAILSNETFKLRGAQFGLANWGYKANGLQVGAYNYSDQMKGTQIGIYNKAKKLRGFQIGLWNVNHKRKLPFINWNFEKLD